MDNPSRSDLTRARLVDAAIAILADRGYRGLTFVEICRRCDLSRGAIHHHYASLTDLLVDVVREIGSRIARGIETMEGGNLPPEELYSLGIDFVWRQLHTADFAALVQIRTAIPTSPELKERVRDEVRRIHEDWYVQADKLATARRASVDPGVTRIILSALTGASLIDAAIGEPSSDPDREQFRSTLKTLVLR
ncbi:MAG: TetR/AcrR family transcriptional regulator [Pseudomonadota bacterium]